MDWHVIAAACVTLLAGMMAVDYLFGLYAASPKGLQLLGQRWAAKLDFIPAMLGGFSNLRLILVSALGLFLEMMMIRWVSSEIRIFAYFKNFVLIACFLGFGLGCYLSRRRWNALPLVIPPLLIALLVKGPWWGLRQLVQILPGLLGASSEVNIWGVPSLPKNAASLGALAVGVALTVPLFTLIAIFFLPFGQMVGWYLENAAKGIRAYTINVLASLAGIALYTSLCFWYQPPPLWFLVATALLVALMWPLKPVRTAVALAWVICAAVTALRPGDGRVTYWSPYQKLTVRPERIGNELISYELNTNDSWYQHVLNLSPDFVLRHADLFRDQPIEWNSYNLPYRFCSQPGSVLILGAGMGNDVAAALRSGATRVVAVEIDPLILGLGKELHFEKPYQSPRVETITDDARSYIQSSSERFDLIVFSLLDSHTTSSHFSNIRIDNFVYTAEAMRAARRLLRPDGMFIVKFQVNTPWIAGRLQGLIEDAFGRTPIQVQSDPGYTTVGRFFIISGSDSRMAAALATPGVQDYVRTHRDFPVQSATLTRDDWPYFYQHEPGLPLSVIAICAAVLLMWAWAIRRTSDNPISMRWHFFFLGAGFLLLEAQIVSQAALLFGTTWVVNSIVVSLLLLLIVLANLAVDAFPRLPLPAAYCGLLLCGAISYAVPPQRLFFASLWMKIAVTAVVLCLPVVFAGIIFIRSFAQVAFASDALGSNLFGALVGGLLESMSFWLGMKSLTILALCLYVGSALALRTQTGTLRARVTAANAAD